MTEHDVPPLREGEDPERHWLQHVYRRGERQLTVRAVIAGMAIGGLMCLSNLYVVLKTGWSLGVTLTACILAFALFEALRRARLTRQEFTILENNAMGSVASAAGYMTGGGNMAALPALLMLTPVRPDAFPMFLWFAAIAALGVFAAIPVKRQLVNRERLAFPTGTATAETLRSLHGALHAEGGRTGLSPAHWLGLAGLAGGLLAFFRDAKASWMPFHVPASLALPLTLGGRALKDWTLAFKLELVLPAAGALMSFRTGWSLLLGGLGTYAVLAPSLVADGLVKEVGYKAIVGWTLWPGASLLVAAGLTSFVFDWRSVVRSFAGLGKLFGRRQAEEDPLAEIECPDSWFPLGFLILGPIVIVLMAWLFQIPWWAGVIALPLAVVMGFVAARVTGETDVTPTKALGPVTQLLFGVLTPGNLPGNLMSANVTGGIGLHAADLLTDLKSGYLLGANPRQQFVAQLFGVLAGAAVVVPAFHLLVPDPSMLGGEEWPAPSALVWAGVSQAFAGGLDALPSSARAAALVGALLGVALALLEKLAPKPLRPFVPSPSGLGIAMVIPGSNCMAMFFGAAIAEAVRRLRPSLAEKSVVPIASGFIAGESLMGIVIAGLVVAGVLSK